MLFRSKKIFEAKQEVISFIGVLEHIINLDEIFDAIKENKNIHYIYFSVPMFSYSIMFESVFDSVFNRNLGGAHTHLFSNGSIEYLCKKYSWEIVSQWRFGTDIPDLIRSISVLMDKNGNSMLSDFFKKKAISVMDDLQLVIDKSGLCSEIHILVKKTV